MHADQPEGDPIALVKGEPFTQLPLDLYIPPDALEVFLDAFEGPLDLLLYLIKRQNLDILNIPIAEITAQYMKYIGLMETMRLELAAEYLVMAAMLAEIKSRMLLPRMDELSDDEDDPRAELIRRLQEYERIKEGAETLEDMPRIERENFQLKVEAPTIERELPLPDITLKELMLALRDVAERAHLAGHHEIARETLSVRARMSAVLTTLQIGDFCEFTTLFNPPAICCISVDLPAPFGPINACISLSTSSSVISRLASIAPKRLTIPSTFNRVSGIWHS